MNNYFLRSLAVLTLSLAIHAQTVVNGDRQFTGTVGAVGGVTAGQAGTATGQVGLVGLTSGLITIKPNDIAGSGIMLLPSGNSNPVQGIANPSDTQVINYISTDGVQHRITGGVVSMTTGAGVPLSTCSAPTSNGLQLYTDSTNHDLWACVGTNMQKKILATDNTGAWISMGNVGTSTDCGTVASGQSCLFVNSANANHVTRKDDTQALHDLEIGVVSMATGTGAPGPTCTGPTSAGLQLYTDDTNHDLWACVGPNMQKKLLATDNSGAWISIGNVGVSSDWGLVASGQSCLFVNSANSNHLTRKDDTQALHDIEAGSLADPGANGVVTRTAMGITAVVTGISSNCVRVDGTSIACGGAGGSTGWILSPTPTFNPAAGLYNSAQNVVIACTGGATPYYSTNNTTVNAYSSPIAVSSTATMIARCQGTGYDPGPTTSAAYTINAGYIGPGNVVTSTLPWYGMRAYSLAKVGTRMVRICNAGEANCADIVSLSNGGFDVATAQAAPLNCGGSGGTCTINAFYDQNVTNSCGGTCDITASSMAGPSPTLVFNAVGSKPGVSFSGSTWTTTNTLASPITQPFSVSVVAKGSGGAIIGSPGYTGGVLLSGGSGAIYSGAALGETASETAFHSINGLFNGASSSLMIDGILTSGNAGANPVSAVNLSGSDAGWQFTGIWLESGYLPGNLSASFSALNTNQHAYWGF